MSQAKLRGRPKAAVTKERITIRLSPDVAQPFRATGDGWQTRIDAALRDWLKKHSPSIRPREAPVAAKIACVLARIAILVTCVFMLPPWPSGMSGFL